MDNKIEIPNYQKIRNSKDLRSALNFFSRAISAGILKQYWDKDKCFATRESVQELIDMDGFPDDIEMYFIAPDTGMRYSFCVDTYHGSGGEWVVISPETPSQ